MPQDRTQDRRTTQPAEPQIVPPGAGEPSPLLQQADAFANVAREEYENCVRGEDAETTLQRRRNTSGQ